MSTRPVLARLGTMLFDIAMVCVAYAFALWLRFDGDVPNVSWNYLIWAGPLIGLAYVLAYYVVGVYRTAWQYAGARDAVSASAAPLVTRLRQFTDLPIALGFGISTPEQVQQVMAYADATRSPTSKSSVSRAWLTVEVRLN